MHYSSGFVLGLSTGAVCLAYCGPVIIPYILGEGKPISGNIGSLLLFLAGRLLAYLLIGLLAGLAGTTLLQPFATKHVFMGILYLILALLLIAYGFHRFREVCLGHGNPNLKKYFGSRFPIVLPVAGGFVTGLNLCPPLLLAITDAVKTGNVGGSLVFFFLFFLGTMIYFLPVPFIAFFRRQHILRIIGKFAAILAGLLYFYKGAAMVLA